MQSTFFDDVNETSQKKTDKHQHCKKSIPSQRFEVDSIGIEKYHFNIKPENT
jgi:hypothetical protein